MYYFTRHVNALQLYISAVQFSAAEMEERKKLGDSLKKAFRLGITATAKNHLLLMTMARFIKNPP